MTFWVRNSGADTGGGGPEASYCIQREKTARACHKALCRMSNLRNADVDFRGLRPHLRRVSRAAGNVIRAEIILYLPSPTHLPANGHSRRSGRLRSPSNNSETHLDQLDMPPPLCVQCTSDIVATLGHTFLATICDWPLYPTWI